MMDKNALYIIFIIIINYTKLILAEPVQIINLPGQFLSTDIEYAIYWPKEKKCARYIDTDVNNNDDMQFMHSEELSFCDVNNKDKLNDTWRWKIEKNPDNNYYGLKNKASNMYLSYKDGDIQPVYFPDMKGAEDVDLYFQGFEKEYMEELPTVGLSFKTYLYSNGLRLTKVSILYVDHNDRFNIKVASGDITESSYLVFVPLTFPIPTSCDIENEEPDELKFLIDHKDIIPHDNEKSVPETYTHETSICNKVTTKWTRTSGSELAFSYTISYSTPKIVGSQIKAEYDTKMTYTASNTFETEEVNEVCVTTGGDITCPPRSYCEREVTSYEPATESISMTINATCDGIKYVVESVISVEGWVYTKVVDRSTPFDCEYYTDVYGDLNNGHLPFCDTCNDDQKCEICRDGYLLLDGVCISAYVCDYVCGGEIKGEGSEGIHDKVPWSGGWCAIIDQTKYQSIECRDELGQN